MKKLYPLLSVLFLISVGFSQNKVNINNLVQYGDKWFKENDDQPFSGIVFDMDKETGNKIIEGRYKNGIRNGSWIWWNNDGRIDSSGIYKDDEISKQTYIEYFSNGNKKREENFVFEYSSTRDKRLIGKERQKRNDRWTEWYENGIFVIKKQSGRWTEWYENGNIFKEGFYKNDSMEGNWSFYDTKGNQYKGKGIDYKNLERIIENDFNLDGKFLSVDRHGYWTYYSMKNGKGHLFSFYPSGRIYQKWIIEVGYTNGLSTKIYETRWYKNGQKKEEVTYKDREKDGLVTFWNKDGSKKSELKYINGTIDCSFVPFNNQYYIQQFINLLIDGLEIWGMEEFFDNGIKSYPNNPFETFSTLPECSIINNEPRKGKYWSFRNDTIYYGLKYKWFYDSNSGTITKL